MKSKKKQMIFLGLMFILAAFWTGTLENVAFSLLGFLSFFVIGITLIIEARKKKDEE